MAIPTAIPSEPFKQEVGKPRRKGGGLLESTVEIGCEVDRLKVDIGKQLHRDRRELRLGVPVGGRAVSVDRAEVTLPVHQRVTKREFLHHSNERVVHCTVPVRVVLAEHVPDDGRAFLVVSLWQEAQFVHGVQRYDGGPA